MIHSSGFQLQLLATANPGRQQAMTQMILLPPLMETHTEFQVPDGPVSAVGCYLENKLVDESMCVLEYSPSLAPSQIHGNLKLVIENKSVYTFFFKDLLI